MSQKQGRKGSKSRDGFGLQDMPLYYTPCGHAIHGTLAVATRVNGYAARRLAPFRFYTIISTSNKLNTLKQTNQQSTKETASKEKRDSTISFRVSSSQRLCIEKLAEKCGMSLSCYVLSRASGYEPKPRLTHNESLILEELLRNRSDYVRYASMLNGMSQEQRRNLFRDNAWMRGALERLAKAADGILHIINKYFSSSKMPKHRQLNASTTTQTNKE